MGLQETYRGRTMCPSCDRESQPRVSTVMMVVSQNELKRKLSVGPGFIVDKTTLVLVKFTLHHWNACKLSPQDRDTPFAYLQTAMSG